jgi:methylated-DNA-[protein]-cysteine S-methyltransferase
MALSGCGPPSNDTADRTSHGCRTGPASTASNPPPPILTDFVGFFSTHIICPRRTPSSISDKINMLYGRAVYVLYSRGIKNFGRGARCGPSCVWKPRWARFGFRRRDGALSALRLPGEGAPEGEMRQTPLLREAAAQLGDYFAGWRARFDLPLAPRGTAFERAVWAALLEIPAGETATYGGVARAVGAAKGRPRGGWQPTTKNPLPILIPCHRVIDRARAGRWWATAAGCPLERGAPRTGSAALLGQGSTSSPRTKNACARRLRHRRVAHGNRK